ncbi:sideroflexin-4 [Kryptolebias marmoratus]|uniref:sideroflexin-4 n=1 Tax=Kryptolebias marmoratus TaxID=37003 RepID=UPI0018AC9F42|nr:sideroflexin-4 [Kryptolebias marmoratus]
MDPNLLLWKPRGQSFVHRFQTWLSLLDPSLLLSSDAEILKAREALPAAGQQLDEKVPPAEILSLSSVHADSGAVLPFVFRPPAYFPVLGPLVVGGFLPHPTVGSTLVFQSMLQIYSASFSFANRNSSAEQKASLKQLLLIAGSAFNTAVGGALPHIFIIRLGVSSPTLQTFCRSFLPVPLQAALAALNVFIVRSEETETGIRVFDSEGNPVGFSKAAAEKAVRETAQSRAVLFGTTAAAPHLVAALLYRTRLLQRRPLLAGPCHYISTALVLGLMVPLSFSLFPQLGSITRGKLEAELRAEAAGEEFYFHRGL